MDEFIPEDFLHYVWKNRLYKEEMLECSAGKIEVIETGEHNKASGPDFFNARIKVNGTLWAGNVEIHTKASDWFRHRHQEDPAYDNVILHVVAELDCQLERPGGEIIPAVVLAFDHSLFEKYKSIVSAGSGLMCGYSLNDIPGIFITDCIGKMLAERLEEKTSEVASIARENFFDWEETLYRFVGRGFGFKLNAQPFEMLVRTTPLMILMKYRNRPLTVNAILFGQAGFLEDLITEDGYYGALQREYHSIKSLLPGRVLGQHMWKFMGSRPANFPTIRISQFASLVTGYFPLFRWLLDNFTLGSWQNALRLGTEMYWRDHYLFGKPGKLKKNSIGDECINLLIINSFIPVFFHYAVVRKKDDLKDELLSMLGKLPPEKNNITERWEKFGIKAVNCFETQGLIHLSTRYCEKKNCLECLICNRILRNTHQTQ